MPNHVQPDCENSSRIQISKPALFRFQWNQFSVGSPARQTCQAGGSSLVSEWSQQLYIWDMWTEFNFLFLFTSTFFIFLDKNKHDINQTKILKWTGKLTMGETLRIYEECYTKQEPKIKLSISQSHFPDIVDKYVKRQSHFCGLVE